MRFYLFDSLCKLGLAKYSLALSIQALLFSVIVRRLNYRMSLQSSLATHWQNKNSIRLYTYDARISCNNKETTLAIENGTEFDSQTVISETKMLSLKSLFLFLNPYQDERYFGISFLKSLFFETSRTAQDFTEEIFFSKKNTSKKIPSRESSQSDLKNALCKVNDFSKNKCDGSKRWATWETIESDVSYQSYCQLDKPSKHSEVSIFAENYCVKVETVPLKAVSNDNGCIRGNRHQTIREILMATETSTFEPMSEPNCSRAEHYSNYLKAEHAIHCAAKKPQYTKTHKTHTNTSKNVNLAFEKAKPKRNSSNIPDSFYRSEREFKSYKSFKVPKRPMDEKKSNRLETNKLKIEEKFSDLIWSIMLDDSNSDLQILEDEVNKNSTDTSLLRHVKKSNTSHNSDFNKAYEYNNSLMYTPKKQACFTQFTIEKEKVSDVSEEHPMAKRTRANSADSGVCLDSNFEEILPDSPVQESTTYKDARNETNVCQEFLSGVRNSEPLYVDDCYKVCQLCHKIILEFFLSCRFGLLLNCFHSFCYPCIRNHSESKRFCTDPVRCPKCGKTSPGIVSSPRWIRDTHEKIILFQKYEKESKFFRKQQQVFLNLF